MLNGKLKGHQDLWQALVRVEKMFATMNDEVIQFAAYAHRAYLTIRTSFHISMGGRGGVHGGERDGVQCGQYTHMQTP